MDNDSIIMLVSALGGIALTAIAGKVAWNRIKLTLGTIQDLIKHLLMAVKDNQLTKEEIEELMKDGKNIVAALKGKYAESDVPVVEPEAPKEGTNGK